MILSYQVTNSQYRNSTFEMLVVIQLINISPPSFLGNGSELLFSQRPSILTCSELVRKLKVFHCCARRGIFIFGEGEGMEMKDILQRRCLVADFFFI
jgi:hypothetical protein